MKEETDLHIRTLSGLNFLVGTWLVVSPYLLNYNSRLATLNQVIFGVMIAGLSIWRFRSPDMELASWLNGLAGLWLIVAPFILSYSRDVTYWNEVVSAIIVAVVAFWNLDTYSGRYERPI